MRHAANNTTRVFWPQALDHTSRTLRQFGVRQAPTAGLLQAQHYSTAKAAYDASESK